MADTESLFSGNGPRLVLDKRHQPALYPGMSNPFDSGWLSALKLPGRIVAGVFLFFALVLALDYFGVTSLVALHPLALVVAILGLVLFGSLSVAALLGVVYDAIMQGRGRKLLTARRDLRREEAKQDRAEHEAHALKRLDYLSKDEIDVVADCLRKNEQSFLAYSNSPPISNLMAAGLVSSPGGEHHMDYYPFYFRTFAWEALLARKDEFIAKDDEHKRREAEEERKKLQRRGY